MKSLKLLLSLISISESFELVCKPESALQGVKKRMEGAMVHEAKEAHYSRSPPSPFHARHFLPPATGSSHRIETWRHLATINNQPPKRPPAPNHNQHFKRTPRPIPHRFNSMPLPPISIIISFHFKRPPPPPRCSFHQSPLPLLS